MAKWSAGPSWPGGRHVIGAAPSSAADAHPPEEQHAEGEEELGLEAGAEPEEENHTETWADEEEEETNISSVFGLLEHRPEEEEAMPPDDGEAEPTDEAAFEEDWFEPLPGEGEENYEPDDLEEDYVDQYGNVMAEEPSPHGEDGSPPHDEPEDAEKPEGEAAAEDDSMTREGDLSLAEIPEEDRAAIQGNIALKRMLSQDEDQPAAKRRKQNDSAMSPLGAKLLRQLRLDRDSAATFVMRVAEPAHVETLTRANWRPSPAHKRSNAEQLYEQLIRLREKNGAPGGPLDVVAAFGYKWLLSASDDESLARLDHKRLRHVFREYDRSRPLSEVVEDSQVAEDPDGDDVPAPNKPGVYVMGRCRCLELIDPFGDALVLGDANLTFSLELAEHRKALSHLGRTIATTFETLDTLRERYTEIDRTIKQLEDLGCEVMHNVDATRLAADPRFAGMEGKFGAVYYNFPHAGVIPGFFDNHPFVRWRHANLMHLFFRALRTFMKPGGQVKVASNSKATGVRYSDIIRGGENSDFCHDETFGFLEWQLCHYLRSYGDRRDSHKRPEEGEVYNAQRANTDMVYCFSYKPTGKPPAAPEISPPPTKEELMASDEGRAGRLPTHRAGRKKKVDELYDLFLSYVQGIHVG